MRWRIEGIDSDARRTASAAAKAAGLPLGRWLERAITDHFAAGESPPSRESSEAARASAGAAGSGLSRPVAPQAPGASPASAPARDAADISRASAAPAPIGDRTSAGEAAAASIAAPPDTALTIPAAPRGDAPATADAIADHKARLATRLRPGRRTLGVAAATLGAAVILAGALWHWRDWPRDPATSHRAPPSVATVAPSLSAPPPTPAMPAAPSASQSAAPQLSPPSAPPSLSPPGPPVASAPALPPRPVSPPPAAPPALDAIIADLRRDAATGDAMAQHDLGLAYVTGRGVTQDYELAAEWFGKATAHGLERAQYNLAVLYENGLGVARDPARSRELYAAAAEQGFALAQHNLGVIYAEGRGVARDFRAAALWFRRAADQGIASAQFNLGSIYERGLAGPPDERTAYGLYRQAAAGGSQAAIGRLAVLDGRIAPPAAGAGAGQKLTRTEIAEMQQILAQLAFDPGRADGQAGPATRAAIRSYQQVAGLPGNGEPSAALLAHLRQVVGMMARP